MTWTRLDDDFTDSPEMLRVGRSARLLHVEALVWSNKHLTDGHIPPTAARRFSDSENLEADIDELVRAGLWQVDDGWLVDWTGQESSDRVLERRKFNADRQRAYRERGEKHARGDHSDCTAGCPQSPRNASRNGDRVPSVTATRPVPSRPLGRDENGDGAGAPGRASAGAPAGLGDRSEDQTPSVATPGRVDVEVHGLDDLP